MKNYILLFSSLLFMTISFSQEQKNIENKFIQEKTDYTHIIDGVEYPVYVSKRKNKVYKNGTEILNHVSYFIKMTDKDTGREYMKLLEKVDLESK